MLEGESEKNRRVEGKGGAVVCWLCLGIGFCSYVLLLLYSRIYGLWMHGGVCGYSMIGGSNTNGIYEKGLLHRTCPVQHKHTSSALRIA